MLYELLDKLNIKYEEVTHNEVYTVDDTKNINLDGIGVKNIFLKCKNKYILVLIKDDKRLNIKELSKLLNLSHLSFGDVEEILNVKTGSVSPLNIINDKENKVLLVIDEDLKNKKLLMHPSINTKTLSMNYEDLIKFITYLKHDYIEIKL